MRSSQAFKIASAKGHILFFIYFLFTFYNAAVALFYEVSVTGTFVGAFQVGAVVGTAPQE